MTVLIIHGIEGHAGIHWQQWLYDQLIKKGHKVIMPDMPDADKPDRNKWLKKTKQLLKDINPSNLVIVAHSLGVTTALDYIEESGSKIKALISVSGFASDYGAELNSYFLEEKNVNWDKVTNNLKEAFVIYGNDDPYVPQDKLEEVAERLGVESIVIEKGGHLNTSSGFTEFPQLIEIFNQFL